MTQDYHFIRIYVNGVLNRVAEYVGDPMSDELQAFGSGSGQLKRYIVLGNTGVKGLAMVLFAGLREQLSLNDVPKAFKGIPIALVTAGILAMAFMGFSGLV